MDTSFLETIGMLAFAISGLILCAVGGLSLGGRSFRMPEWKRKLLGQSESYAHGKFARRLVPRTSHGDSESKGEIVLQIENHRDITIGPSLYLTHRKSHPEFAIRLGGTGGLHIVPRGELSRYASTNSGFPLERKKYEEICATLGINPSPA